MFYLNRRGEPVHLTVTEHAKNRFLLRWNLLYPHKQMRQEDVGQEIEYRFAYAKRVENLSNAERHRMKQHGQDTLFFRTNDFTFVVQNGTVLTIEISNNDMRHMNKFRANRVAA